MRDIECPYCGTEQDIDHDDCYGYEECTLHKQDCINCKKTFGYYTYVSYNYDPIKLPCANGEDHELEDVQVFPKEFGVGKKRCKYCGEEVVVDELAYKKAIKAYLNQMGVTASE